MRPAWRRREQFHQEDTKTRREVFAAVRGRKSLHVFVSSWFDFAS
jgi:hypothetical protein